MGRIGGGQREATESESCLFFGNMGTFPWGCSDFWLDTDRFLLIMKL